MQNIRKMYFLAIAILSIALILFLSKNIFENDFITSHNGENSKSNDNEEIKTKVSTVSSSATKITSIHPSSNEVSFANDLEALTLSRTKGEGTSLRLIDSLGGVTFDLIKKYSLSSDDVIFITDTTNDFINKSSEAYAKNLSNSIIAKDNSENAMTYYINADPSLLSAAFSEFKSSMINHFGSKLGEELSRSFPAESYFGGMGNRNVKISVRQLNGDTFNAIVTEYDSKNNRPIRSSQLFYEQFNRMYPNLLDDKGSLKNHF